MASTLGVASTKPATPHTLASAGGAGLPLTVSISTNEVDLTHFGIVTGTVADPPPTAKSDFAAQDHLTPESWDVVTSRDSAGTHRITASTTTYNTAANAGDAVYVGLYDSSASGDPPILAFAGPFQVAD